MTSFFHALRIKEVKEKILFSILFIVIYRFGSYIPISGVDVESIKALFSNGGILSFIDLFSGGSLSRFSIFALGILPYINASIIMQMMSFVMPSLKDLAKEGVAGQKKIAQYTRLMTVGLALLQGTVMAVGFKQFLLPETSLLFFLFYAIIGLVAGATLVMWIAELMSEYGIGNGASLLIFIGIIAEFPLYIKKTFILVSGGTNVIGVFFMVITLLVMIASIVYFQEAERRVQVQYAKRVVGRKMMGAQSSYIPFRLIQGGVLPIIFASALLQFPMLIGQYIQIDAVQVFFQRFYSYNSVLYNGSFALLIFFFCYFYTAISFNPVELSKQIKQNGGFILGVRPGKPTEEYLERTVSTLTLFGSLFLASIALFPVIMANITKVDSFQGLGGTALLIIVGVAMDLLRQFDTFVVSAKYDGVS